MIDSTHTPPNMLAGPRPWAFSQAELTAGLRRHTGDPVLAITSMQEREITQRLPAVGRLRGIEVFTKGALGENTFELVVKEPQGSTRAGAAGAGLREASIYLTLKEHLPVRMPTLIAAHPKGEWIILIHLPPGRRPSKWQAADYLLATDQLAVLHDRFWGLGEDLATYSWLENPLKSAREIYLKAAQTDAAALAENQSKLLNTGIPILALTEKILAGMDTILAGLNAIPATFLHGDYWPGNIHIHSKSGLTVFDWEDAAIGPGVLDLLSFVQSSAWHFSPLPLPPEEIVTHYRTRLSQAGQEKIKDEQWLLLWDDAIMWTFVTGWTRILVRMPEAMLSTRMEALNEVLFTPLQQAVARRFP